MLNHRQIGIAAISLLLMFFGCDSSLDNVDSDTIESSDQLTIELNQETLTVSWTEDSENSTTETYYRLYSSASPMDDLETTLTEGTAETEWSEGTGQAEIDLSSEEYSETTYFNLVSGDASDNTENLILSDQTAYLKITYQGNDDGDQSYMVQELPSAGLDEFYMDLDISPWYDQNDENPEVFYIFTNAGSDGEVRPLIEESDSSVSSSVSRGVTGTSNERETPVSILPLALRGLPEGMKTEPVSADDSSRSTSRDTTDWAASGDSAEEGNETTGIFYTDSETGDVAATCRAVVNANGVTLNIWVADDCWEDSTTKTFLVTDEMVDAMAEAFLMEGENNDIYEWVSGIFGEEWGEHSSSSYIGDNDEITIFLYDIGGDGGNSDAPYDTSVGSYTAGYFWSRDNYLSSRYSGSNERIMFYIDAPVFACPDDPTEPSRPGRPSTTEWDVTGYYPSDQISTLAHEFQHMIMYYQKTVLTGRSPDTWLNEMCSMIAEDLLADKMGVQGPRGMDITDEDYSGGYESDESITGGRLPVYNYYADGSLTGWDSSSEMVLADYALAYSFGAYLARNYGGAALFREIVQNSYADDEAVTTAIAALYDLDTEAAPEFEELLAGWGSAVLLSDEVRAEEENLLNSDASGFSSTAGTDTGTIDYTLGGINLYRFDYIESGETVQEGPYTYGLEADEDYYGSTENNVYEDHEAASNVFYQDTKTTDSMLRKFTVGSDVRLTLIVKE